MSTPNMSDLILLTQQITSLKSDVEGVKDRVVDLEEGGGGGEGGAAYPDSFYFETETGESELTASEQGYITALVSGVTFNLPEVAEDGTTFKFLSGAQSFIVDGGARAILTFAATSFKVNSGMLINIVAFNLDIGAGLGLYWIVTDAATIGISSWDADTRYLVGMMVLHEDRKYLCINSSVNINYPPDENTNYWSKIPEGHDKEISDSVAEGDITFGADVAPSGFNGASVVFKTANGVISLLQVDASYTTPGTDVNQVVIDLSDFVTANVTDTVVPPVNTVGTAYVNGAAVVCKFGVSTNTITIDLPSAGIVGTTIHAKIVF